MILPSPLSERSPNLLISATEIQNGDEPPLCHRFCSLCSRILSQSDMLDQLANGKEPLCGTEERWQHHASIECLEQSADDGCHFCSLLFVRCCSDHFNLPNYLRSGQQVFIVVPGSDRSLDVSLVSDHPHESSAKLSVRCKQSRDTNIGNTSVRSMDQRAMLPRSTSSETSMQVIRDWLNECRSTHRACGMQGFIPLGRPKRVIVIPGSVLQPQARLVSTKDLPADFEYVTLSHCWGLKSHLTLTRASLSALEGGINPEDLPKTFRDAVEITIRSGFRALWIDAICIVQDDIDEVKAEVPRMGVIYGNCAFTIGVLHSNGSDEGCFVNRKPLAWSSCQVTTKSGHSLEFGPSRLEYNQEQLNLYSFRDLRDAPPLQRRSWVVQERALSPRTVYFGNIGLHFECCTMTTFEKRIRPYPGHDLTGFDKGRLKTGLACILRDFDHIAREPISGSMHNVHLIGSWHDQWWHLVAISTRCHLTRSSDRWPAIAGISAVFELAAGIKLIAGLWKGLLYRDMLWEAGWALLNEGRKRIENNQPTWSWLSIEGPVNLDRAAHEMLEERWVAKILSISEPSLALPPSGVVSTSARIHMVIAAPMAQIPRPKEVSGPDAGYDAFTFDESRILDSTAVSRELLEFLARGEWTADIPVHDDGTKERRWGYEWSSSHELWALLWTDDTREVNLLIVRPDDQSRKTWTRVGMFNRWRRTQWSTNQWEEPSRRIDLGWPDMTIHLY